MSASAPVRLRGRVAEAARQPEPPRRRPGRALGACALLLIGTLLLPLSLATVWARSELTDTPTALVADLAARYGGGEVPGLTVTRPTLEDVYLEMIGHE